MSRIIDELTRDRVEVMTAYLMKRDIEVKINDDGGFLAKQYGDEWHKVVSEPTWNWDKATWRIKPPGVKVKELIERLKEFDGGLRVNLNFDGQNFNLQDLWQDGDILDIFPTSEPL